MATGDLFDLNSLKRECEYHESPEEVAEEWGIFNEVLGSMQSLIAYKDALEDRITDIRSALLDALTGSGADTAASVATLIDADDNEIEARAERTT